MQKIMNIIELVNKNEPVEVRNQGRLSSLKRDTLIIRIKASHGNTSAGAQLPAMPSFSRILGSPFSPGLLRVQHQEQEAAQPCGFPGNRPPLSGLREVPEDQIAMNLVPPPGQLIESGNHITPLVRLEAR